jgi:hypothetical protein
MNLIDGLIISTLNDSELKSKHSLLMEFYSLDKETKDTEDKRFNDWINSSYSIKSEKGKQDYEVYKSYDLSLHFMRVKAVSLLKILNVI